MFFVLMLVLFVVTDGAENGDPCTVNKQNGICMQANKCQTSLEDINKDYSVCQSRGSEVIVCCDEDSISLHDEQCDPIPASMTANKTGQKAWDKCIDYQRLVFPCEGGVRDTHCPYSDVVELVVGGNTEPKRHEFPHLVLLGYTNEKKQLDWLCAGALVSERFVLTAAHCLYSRTVGPATHIAVNPADRSDISPSDIYRIKSVFRHPEYRPPRTYHDLALLELEQAVPLSRTVVPACIVGSDPEERDVTATTWNTHDILHTGNTRLRKIRLSRFSAAECNDLYPEMRRGGYNDTTQTCYGDNTGTKDMCQDDGGAPLVVRHKHVPCMYSVVGVASYGRGCFAHSPGVYSRLHPYVRWIETLVWTQ